MPMAWASSMIGWKPTFTSVRANAQFTDPAVARRKVIPPLPGSAFSVRPNGGGNSHGDEPSTMSLGDMPEFSAAARVIVFHVEPAWRPGGVVAMLYCDCSKPGPATMAFTAPVFGSI